MIESPSISDNYKCQLNFVEDKISKSIILGTISGTTNTSFQKLEGNLKYVPIPAMCFKRKKDSFFRKSALEKPADRALKSLKDQDS